jgi:hypothetical protein
LEVETPIALELEPPSPDNKTTARPPVVDHAKSPFEEPQHGYQIFPSLYPVTTKFAYPPIRTLFGPRIDIY